MASRGKHRQVIESGRFTTERAALEPDARRFDEAMDGLIFALCRNPAKAGMRVEETGLWATCIRFFGGPTFAVFYTFTEDTVTLESVYLDPFFDP